MTHIPALTPLQSPPLPQAPTTLYNSNPFLLRIQAPSAEALGAIKSQINNITNKKNRRGEGAATPKLAVRTEQYGRKPSFRCSSFFPRLIKSETFYSWQKLFSTSESRTSNQGDIPLTVGVLTFARILRGGAAVVWAKMQLKNGEFESKLLGLMTSELIRACELEHTNWNFHILFHVASQCAKWRPKVITPTRRNFAKMPWTLFVIKTSNQKKDRKLKFPENSLRYD